MRDSFSINDWLIECHTAYLKVVKDEVKFIQIGVNYCVDLCSAYPFVLAAVKGVADFKHVVIKVSDFQLVQIESALRPCVVFPGSEFHRVWVCHWNHVCMLCFGQVRDAERAQIIMNAESHSLSFIWSICVSKSHAHAEFHLNWESPSSIKRVSQIVGTWINSCWSQGIAIIIRTVGDCNNEITALR